MPTKIEKSLLLKALDLKIYELNSQDQEFQKRLDWFTNCSNQESKEFNKLKFLQHEWLLFRVYVLHLSNPLLSKASEGEFSKEKVFINAWSRTIDRRAICRKKIMEYQAFAAVIKFCNKREITIADDLFEALYLPLSVIYKTVSEVELEGEKKSVASQ